ncbi:FFLEELY motif protein [Roseateles saccharophilus]|uniref:DUF8198 domain-containing protein n=1 Tax=Roseateles saccharophilus TaxID=304 RepID=A0A4R3V7M3_ROSSA|nr:hypothetical protein [Roseateles saccharophilus]MDG0835702.1 hypothetical protein [Roseateles saccharophilus]TCV01076.1 hypothetical protein EV671_10062 [Roseateles saccharophilus]
MQEPSAESLLEELRAVDAERARRAADPALEARVQALKTWQQRRFAHTYADLLAHPRYEAATRFFLHELYGPDDYRQRDAQFARVIPTLTRLFPDEVVDTVARLARLHALSERLDTCMAEHLPSAAITAQDYANAWLACGEPASRQQQIELTMAVGEALDRLTRKPLLRQTLKLMRGPAQMAGLGALQSFLESIPGP